MAHRSFELAPSKHDPPTFSVAGREFKCLSEPPAGVLTDLIASADGSPAMQAAGLVGFIAGCLSDVDAEQFRLTIYDKDTVVPLDTLGDIASWLAEEYTKPRPTTPSSSSQPGATTTPATSEDGASSHASTPPALDL